MDKTTDIASLIVEGMVLKSKDKTGDFANELMFIGKPPKLMSMGGNQPKLHYYVMFKDGYGDWLTLEELNADPKTIRKYDPNTDPDFYGAHG